MIQYEYGRRHLAVIKLTMSPTKMILIIIPPRMARTMSQLIEPNSTSESTRSKIIKDLMGKKKLVLGGVSALLNVVAPYPLAPYRPKQCLVKSCLSNIPSSITGL